MDCSPWSHKRVWSDLATKYKNRSFLWNPGSQRFLLCFLIDFIVFSFTFKFLTFFNMMQCMNQDFLDLDMDIHFFLAWFVEKTFFLLNWLCVLVKNNYVSTYDSLSVLYSFPLTHFCLFSSQKCTVLITIVLYQILK